MLGKNEKDIDFSVVDELLVCGCTGVEIAGHFGVCPDTLYRRVEILHGMTFSAYSQQKRSKGDAVLRQAQFYKAKDGDNSMLIWLGKNRLKQSDSPQEISVSTEIAENFKALMDQISLLQSSRASSEIKCNNDK